MEKLKLGDLRVESFATVAVPYDSGTVQGHDGASELYSACPYTYDCSDGWGTACSSCNGSCQVSCANTCPVSCAHTNCLTACKGGGELPSDEGWCP